MKKIFVISDTHFGHGNIKVYCNRPLDVEKQMVDNWNAQISDDDVVIVVGDYMCRGNGNGKYLTMISNMLKGTKILISGNHDKYSNEVFIEEHGFSKVVPHLAIGNVFLSHYPMYEEAEIENLIKHNFKEVDALISSMEAYAKSGCEYVVHGHIHTPGKQIYSNHFNVCVDRNNFKPIELSKISAALAQLNSGE